MKFKLSDLTGKVIQLNITLAHSLNNAFHGKTCGRVRFIDGTYPAYWVGEFCFREDAIVKINDDGDYNIYVHA